MAMTDDKTVQLALKRFRLAAEAESEIRREALADLEFRAGSQWPSEVKMQRDREHRPCLTMNRLPQFIRQVANEQRAQQPAVTVNPVGSGADVETAEVYQGVIRHIEVSSDAEVAYDAAFDSMLTGGFGYYRFITDYLPGSNSDQEIIVKRIKNPFTVYFDPAAVEPNYEDARFAFIVADIPTEEYRAEYSSSGMAGIENFESIGDAAPGWTTENTIRVAEYFSVEKDEKGKNQVIWRLINAVEVLDKRTWPGKYIPIVPVLGDDLDIGNRRILSGIVRNARDPQRMYNYWISAATEMIALAPRAPFVAVEGQIKDREDEWRAANTASQAVLQYKPVSLNGQPAPAPQRQVYEPPIQAITLMIRQADNDIKATTGIFDAALGEPGPEQSGKAILARQRQSDVATMNFSDNLARALRHGGRILVDLIPKVYDAPRIQRIVMPDSTVKTVGVYNSQTQGDEPPVLDGVEKVFDLGVGTYDVTVTVGPSYQSRRQEASAAMLELVKTDPAIFPLVGDLMVGDMDWPQAQEIAKRLKAMLPPQVQGTDAGDPESQLAATNGKLQQLMQQHELLTQALQKATETIEQKRIEQDTKLQIAKLEQETDLAVAEINAKAQESRTRRLMEANAWSDMHDAAHAQAMAAIAPPQQPQGAPQSAGPMQQPEAQQ